MSQDISFQAWGNFFFRTDDIMDFLRMRNWEKFQHYKHRNPPWIKFHGSLLDNYEHSCLQDASKAHLHSLWLLAASMNNKIPADAKWIEKRISATEPINLKLLADNGFIEIFEDASVVLAPCKQVVHAEERRGETEERESTHAIGKYQQYVDKVRSCHPAFEASKITDKMILASLKVYPESTWEKAIADFQRQNAGAELKYPPLRCLEGYLRNSGQDRIKSRPTRDMIKDPKGNGGI